MEYQPEKTLVSPWWFSIPFGLILIQIIIAINHHDSMPDIVPIHYDINGNPDNWAKKSYRLLFMQPAIEILLTALLFFIYKVIGWSKQQLSAENPEESRTRNQIFRRRWSAFIILFNVLIIIPSFLLHLFTLQLIKIHPGSSLFEIFSFVPLLLILILTGWIAFKTGQSGSRIKLKNKSEPDEKKVDRDDDKHWKGGIIYHNPDDPAIFVEQRFGVGWTINFGNRKALIGFFGFLVLFPAALFLIARIAIK
jgi:uncharacterized membrane protein